ISHPHFYGNMKQWAEEFDCPVYLHANDKEWIFDPGEYIQIWTGDKKELSKDVDIINIGGHFPGSSILHIKPVSPKGMVLCGDTFYIARSRRHISALYSYPNHIPLQFDELMRINERIKNLRFDSMIGAFDYQSIEQNADQILSESFKGMTKL